MKKQILGTAGVLTAGLLIGSAFSMTSAANAADENATPVATSTSATSATTGTTGTTAPTFTTPDATDSPDVLGPNSVKPGESLVTGDAATKLTDAALAKFPGATVIRVENDSDGDKYEVHLKKADGSVVTVTFDESYNVTGDHEGFADPAKGGPAGGPKGGHGPRGSGDNDGDGPGGAGWTAPTTGTTQSN